MENKKLIITGSSRKEGDTNKVVEKIASKMNCDVIDLNDYQMSYYDYEHQNKHDDYIQLMEDILEKYDTLIYATPVYWYSMSGIMKVFFDRKTDLLTINKDLGRKLRGKKMAVVSSSGGNNLGDDFWLPFSESAKYLGMEYIGDVHTIVGEDNEELIEEFVQKIS